MHQANRRSGDLLSRFPYAPARIQRLPVERRGFPVPWFLAWDGQGEPDFRFVHPARVVQALKRECCWICGEKLGRLKTFAIGPMCAINKVTAEPPCHLECARFAAVACPFLSRPLAKRGEVSEEDKRHSATPGFMIDRNPGVTLLWSCLRFKPWRPDVGKGYLFDLGKPEKAEWYAHGRPATEAEVLDSIQTGLPALIKLAQEDGAEAMAELRHMTDEALKLLPKAA